MTGRPGERMLAEMAQQPAVVGALAARRNELSALVRPLLSPAPAGLVLLARGSSDNAASYGKYILELASGRPVSLAAPSIFTRYQRHMNLDGYLVVGLSQSGLTPEIVESLRDMQAFGARTLAITNAADSPLAHAAQVHMDIAAGPEEAVPATKTFTGQLAALAILAGAFDPALLSPEDWDALPAAMSAVLAQSDRLAAALADIKERTTIRGVARGLLYAVALETGLKISETTGRTAVGISAADLLHGPIATIDESTAVIAFAADEEDSRDLAEAVVSANRRGAVVLAVGPAAALGLLAAEVRLEVPETVEILAPLVQVICGQQLAHGLALDAGIDPDEPFGLSKVTRTT